MKKKGYYVYENGIYPQKLWVHIGNDLPELIDVEFDGCEPPRNGYVGIAYDEAIRKNDDIYEILVSFKSTKIMTMSVCCHEASHACDAIESGIDMEHGGEASAYLLGWIADCINKARLGVGNFVEVKGIKVKKKK